MLLNCLVSLLTLAPITGKDVVHQSYQRYAGKWYHSFIFSQHTEFYRNDSLKGKQDWYEAIKYPNKFRIDFGEKDSGNAVIFTNDSAYRFRNGKLRGTRKDDNDLTFLLGGMYFYTEAQVMQQLRDWHFNLDLAHETTLNGRPVWVVGAAAGDTTSNQLWFDKKELYLVRMIKDEDGTKEDGWFENQKKFGGGWAETRCRFYFNGKLIQVENYFDCKEDVAVDDTHFDPAVFSKRN